MADSRAGAGKGQGGPGTSHVKKQGCAQGLMNVRGQPKGAPNWPDLDHLHTQKSDGCNVLQCTE